MLRTSRRRRVLILALAGVVITAIIVLSASLSNVKFEKGKAFYPPGHSNEIPEGGSIFNFNSDAFWKILFTIFVWVLLPLSLISIIIWPKDLKYILKRAIGVSIVVLSLYYMIFILRDFIRRLLQIALVEGTGQANPDPVNDSLHIAPVHAPGWSAFPFIIGGLAALAFIGWWLLRAKLRSREGRLEEIAGLAGEVAQEIRSGASLKSVVLRCYRDMSGLLSEQKEIRLARAMTVREFEWRLSEAGVKDEHVSRLTRLFEWVRYGGREASEAEESEAVSCLEAIEREYGEQTSRLMKHP